MNKDIINELSKKTIGVNGCHVWQGCLVNGYGQTYDKRTKKGISAHRLMYEATFGKIPKGLVIDHLCRNRACINPEHLEVVTDRENILRGIGPTAINRRRKYCKKGHEFTPENTYISKKGRECKKCHRSWWMDWYYRNKK